MYTRPPHHHNLNGTSLVVGLGQTGLSIVRCLARLGVAIAVADSRVQPPGLTELQQDFPQVPCYLGEFDPALFSAVDQIIVSPGVPLSAPAIAAASQRGIPVLGDIELFARLRSGRLAVITGSNGKSTVTTLLGLMAQQAGINAAVGGNLGLPALDLLAQATADLYILELSSFQLETTSSLDADVACVLNISPDHLDRYPDYDAYVSAKQRIFQGQGIQVLNADDVRVVAMAESDRQHYWFTLQKSSAAGQFGLLQHAGKTWLACGTEPWLAVDELGLKGLHNCANALAALALGTALQLPRQAMLSALQEFTGLSHRSQLIASHSGVRWFNDSKGTNVGATVAAVQGMPGPVVLIAGGEGKEQNFTPLQIAAQHKVRALILLGRDKALIAAAMQDTVPYHFVESMAEAVALAARLAQAGDSIVLSPACASFDMFRNYEERGRVFCAAVEQFLAAQTVDERKVAVC
jgi:UDP-N-acetylmuramoylalanine--D-glutamate ligase